MTKERKADQGNVGDYVVVLMGLVSIGSSIIFLIAYRPFLVVCLSNVAIRGGVSACANMAIGLYGIGAICALLSPVLAGLLLKRRNHWLGRPLLVLSLLIFVLALLELVQLLR